jgi:hypothetical protein
MKASSDAKRERLAAALRENLKRRKAAARKARDGAAEPGADRRPNSGVKTEQAKPEGLE